MTDPTGEYPVAKKNTAESTAVLMPYQTVNLSQFLNSADDDSNLSLIIAGSMFWIQRFGRLSAHLTRPYLLFIHLESIQR
jgi:hypothetical protein